MAGRSASATLVGVNRLAARPGFVAVLAALAALPLVVGIIGWLVDLPLGMDSAVYRAGALTLLHGDPLYDTDTLAFEPWWARLPFTYPPAAALLFVPLALMPLQVAWGALGAVSVLALALSVALTIRALPGPRAGTLLASAAPATAALTAMFVLLEPVWRTISLGQVNLVLLALVMLDLLVISARGSRFGGVLIGVAAAVKLTPLIFIPHLLFTGRRRDALRATGTFAGLQAAMYLLIPHDVSRYWSRAVSDPTRIGTIHWSDNQAINGLVLRLTDSASWSFTVALVVGAVLAPAAVWLMLRYHHRGDAVAAMLVTAFYGLLVSPVSWTHHWVWVVPLLVLLIARLPKPRWAAVAALLVVFGSYVLLVLPGGRDPDRGWSALDHVLGNAYLYVPLVAGAAIIAAALRPESSARPLAGTREPSR